MDTIVVSLTNTVQVLQIAAGLVLFGGLLWAFATFDQIVKREFQEHPDQWTQNGKPSGIFWRPPKSAYVSYFERFVAEWNREWIMLAWLFRAPAWSRDDAAARRSLLRYRILVAIWNVSLLAGVAFSVLAALGS